MITILIIILGSISCSRPPKKHYNYYFYKSVFHLCCFLFPARLPFKTMDQKTQLISPKSNVSKKRKLSDAESPSAKMAKTPKSNSGPVPDSNTTVVSGETEVSSSSEADNVKVRVRNTLERFVRKNSQEEITSSTTNPICIDLSDSEDGKESDISFVELDTCQSKNIKEFFTVTGKESTKKNDTGKVVENYIKVIEAVSKGIITDDEDKENVEKPVTVDADVSINSAGSELDNSTVELKTPGKVATSSTVFKTPISSKSSPKDESTPLSQSPGDSQSDGTPKSSRKSRSKVRLQNF